MLPGPPSSGRLLCPGPDPEGTAETFAHVLRALEEIPSNYAIANEWKRESNLVARKEINSKRRHLHNSKASMTNYLSDRPLNPQEMLIHDGAADLMADLGGCLREIEIAGNHFGKFSLSIVLLRPDQARPGSVAPWPSASRFSARTTPYYCGTLQPAERIPVRYRR